MTNEVPDNVIRLYDATSIPFKETSHKNWSQVVTQNIKTVFKALISLDSIYKAATITSRCILSNSLSLPLL